jgi:putative tryptophan/tyrosine transport system substrate-binding protein
MIARRAFIAGLGAAAGSSVIWPLAARAQQAALPVIGILAPGPPGSYAPPAFHQGLGQAGFVEKRNVTIEYHWADGRYDNLPALAADLVRRQVSVIYASGLPAATAAKAATSEIPVVFSIGANPVELGLVSSLSHPGGNVTGVTNLNGETNTKRLQLLHEAVPGAKIFVAVINPTEPNSGNLRQNLEAAARELGLDIEVLPVSTERDYEDVFKLLRDRRADALVISPDSLLSSRPDERAAMLLRDRVPAISTTREFALAGGLMSYVPADMTRAAGVYTGRILKGEKPASLPVQQATRFDLTINARTAGALGTTFPTDLLARADEVIE